MVKANIDKDASGRIVVSFSYDPSIITKIKAIDGRRWHPAEKHWSFPNQNGILEKILRVFEDKEVQIAPALRANLPTLKGTAQNSVVSAHSNDLRTDSPSIPPLTKGDTIKFSPLEKGGEGGFESGLSPKLAFEDLRRELVSRKYSYKTAIFITIGILSIMFKRTHPKSKMKT